MSDKKVNVKDFAECTFWAVECPECGEMIEVTEESRVGDVVLCDQCDNDFEVIR
jgi:predicted RNA-binding Zn-ribbon protein involved in translation (DUF1610 family)